MHDARSIDMTKAPKFGRNPIAALRLDGPAAIAGEPIPDAGKEPYLWQTRPDTIGQEGDYICEAADGARFIVAGEKFEAEYVEVAPAKKAPAKKAPAKKAP